MRLEKADASLTKGWYLGPWNSRLEIAMGYANAGVDEPHLHKQTTEVYLISRGTAVIRVETQAILLAENQILVVEPGEAHTFQECSFDYFHFVLHIPGLQGEEAKADKIAVPLSRLGLT